MILYLNANTMNGSNEETGMFHVNNVPDAIETIKLMRHLQKYRPERQILEYICVDASVLGTLLLQSLAARKWSYTIHFYECPTQRQIEICQKNQWDVTIAEVCT